MKQITWRKKNSITLGTSAHPVRVLPIPLLLSQAVYDLTSTDYLLKQWSNDFDPNGSQQLN